MINEERLLNDLLNLSAFPAPALMKKRKLI